MCNKLGISLSLTLNAQTTWVVLELQFLGISILNLWKWDKRVAEQLRLNIHEEIELDHWTFTYIGFPAYSEEMG